MKKLFAIALTLSLVLCVFAFPASAAGNGSLSATSASGYRGDTVTVNVNLSSNPGLITMKFQVSYSSNLTLVSVSNSGLLGGWTTPALTISSPYTLRWADSLSTVNNTATGTLATLTFKINDNAKIGTETVTITFNESRDAEGGKNSFNSTSASITVKCRHDYGSWTKLDNNQHGKTCSICNDVQKENHGWDKGTETKTPSCKEEGEKTYSCSVCNGTKTEAVPKTNDHNYSDWVKVDDHEHTHTCSICQGTETVAHTWDNGTETKKATCKETGIMTYTCTATGCGATYTEDIPLSTQHTFGNLTVVDDVNHKDVCSICKDEITQPHKYDNGVVTKKPNCKEEGEKTYTCSGCSHSIKDSIPKTDDHSYDYPCDDDCNICGAVRWAQHSYEEGGDTIVEYKDKNYHWAECKWCGTIAIKEPHYPSEPATETTHQYCLWCGYIIAPALNHTHKWNKNLTTDAEGHWYACSGCEEKKDAAAHDFENGCDPDCATCGYTREVAHDISEAWTSDGTNHWHECTVCGLKEDTAAHEPGAEATEFTAQTCTICGKELVAALGHSFSEAWNSDEESHWRNCACGAKGDLAEHTYEDGVCSICGAEEPKSFVIWIIVGVVAVAAIAVGAVLVIKKKK